jgi:hypothetical protein
MMVSLDEWRRAPPSMEATILTIEAITFFDTIYCSNFNFTYIKHFKTTHLIDG